MKNGDMWTVRRHHCDGSLTVHRLGVTGTLTLPAAYVAEHVELAYSTTAHRAQGSTVDTAHAVVSGPSMTREILYVAMTRGRAANHAYVTTDLVDEEGHLYGDGEPPASRSVLTTILRREGAVLSAHETAHTEADRHRSMGQLAAGYDTIHRAAQADRARRSDRRLWPGCRPDHHLAALSCPGRGDPPRRHLRPRSRRCPPCPCSDPASRRRRQSGVGACCMAEPMDRPCPHQRDTDAASASAHRRPGPGRENGCGSRPDRKSVV